MMETEKGEPRALIRKGSSIHEAISITNIDNTPSARDMDAYMTAYTVYAWVYSAVAKCATSLAGVPLILFEQTVNGELTEIVEHPLLTLLNKPNKFLTKFELMEKTSSFLDITGNSFWELVRDKNGTVVEIYPLNTKYMEIVPSKQNFIDKYRYTVNGKSVDIPVENVVHLKNADPDNEYWGMSRLTAVRDAMVQEKNAIEWNKNFFRNSARPDVIFHVNGPLNRTAFARMKSTIKKLYGGVEKAHSAAIIEGGVKVDMVGFAQKDVEFLNLRRYNRDEILAVLGVPPAIVGVFESSIRANAEEQRKFFWETTMVQKLMMIETILNQYLVPKFSKTISTNKLILLFDLSTIEALGEQTALKTTRLVNATSAGIISRNEAREELGYEPIEGLDTIYIPISSAPAGTDTDEDPPIENEPTYLAINPATIASKDKKYLTWKGVDDRRQRFINDANAELNKYFEALLQRTISNLNSNFEGKLKKLFVKTLNVEAIYADKKETDALNKILSKQIASSIRVAGSLAAIEIAIDIGLTPENFNHNNTNVQTFVKTNALQHASDISNTNKEKLRRQLELALAKEETQDQIVERIKRVLGSDITDARAKLIAENEIGTAFNAGRRMATEQIMNDNLDVKLFKVWISAKDEKVRTTHEINDSISNSVPLDLDKAYPNGLMFPKDPSGPPEETINCRCVESYVSASKAAKMFGVKYTRKVRLTTGVKTIRSFNLQFDTKRSKDNRMILKQIMEIGSTVNVSKAKNEG